MLPSFKSILAPRPCLLAIFALYVVPAAAFAEDTSRPVPDATEYEFEDDLVQGATPGPDGEILQIHRRGRGPSLIRVRTHFIDRLLASVETL